MRKFIFIISAFSFLLAVSCSNDDQTADAEAEIELPEEGIEITGAWARPGRQNGVTAVYMNVANGSAETDTLVSLSSPVSGLVELHETYERENDMMGMREVEEPIFPGNSAVVMRPGGLHIMLMQLQQELNEGDSLELTVEFSLNGSKTLTVPVQSPN